jgi:hypothetical protein
MLNKKKNFFFKNKNEKINNYLYSSSNSIQLIPFRSLNF